MEEKLVLRMTGIVSLAMTAAMLPSLGCALDQEPEMILPFLCTIMIGLAFGAYALRTTVSQRKMRLSIRGGAVFLGVSWLYTSILGAVPYVASGDFSVPKALFESASALTTTGVSSVLEGAPYPSSLLLWHDISQWLGGKERLLFLLSLCLSWVPVLPICFRRKCRVIRRNVPCPISVRRFASWFLFILR